MRKKLRLRAYNSYSDCSMGFTEMKKKYGNAIVKERVGMPFDVAASLVADVSSNGHQAAAIRRLELSDALRSSLDRFLFLKSALWLSPTVLVVYEREAYVGRANPRVRITFDCYMRSMIRPRVTDLFAENGLRYLTNGKRILEIKFDGPMPQWLRPLTASLNRSNRPISKYCRGIDLWLPAKP